MNKKIILNSLIFLSFIALSFAYFVEFVLGHEPCNLCKIERIPYIGSIIIISFLIFTNRWEKILLSITLLLFVFGTITSVYHVGIEQGVFSESLLCELGLNTNFQNPEKTASYKVILDFYKGPDYKFYKQIIIEQQIPYEYSSKFQLIKSTF